MLQSNQILCGRYLVGGEIGSGGSGVVYDGWHLTLQKKIVIKRLLGAHNARAEADILKNLHHPGLPQVYDFVETGGNVYTVMDFVPGISLDKWVERGGRAGLRQAEDWLEELLDVLVYLHGRRPPVLHNDIKPANIMLRPEGGLCLIDFNISASAQGGALAGYTAVYASPEQQLLAQRTLRGKPGGPVLDGRSDLYALAATFYTLITGRAPGPDSPALTQLYGAGPAGELCRILDRAMQPRRGARYASAEAMRRALRRYRLYRGRYRTYLALQTASWAAGLCLAAAGVFLLVTGVRQEGAERFYSEYDAFCSAMYTDTDEAYRLGTAILENEAYTAFLDSDPSCRAQLLHAAGDYYYGRGEYALAAQEYAGAVACEPGGSQAAAFYRDAALAYALAGDVQGASGVLELARGNGVTGGELTLAQAAVYAASGETDACVSCVREVLAECGGRAGMGELCARACVLAAQVQTDAAARVEWLSEAAGYSSSRGTLRMLGEAAYAAYVEHTRSGREYLAAARSCYERLCETEMPYWKDRLNLAAVLRAQGELEQSRRMLEQLAQEYPGEYAAALHLALVCYDLGLYDESRVWCVRARSLWDAQDAALRDAASGELLEELEQRLA